MDSNLDADTPANRTVHICFLSNGPPVLPQPPSRFHNHVTDELALLHQTGPQALRACPGLRAAAVQVNAADIGRNQ